VSDCVPVHSGRQTVAHEIETFDQHNGRGERNDLAAQRIGGKDAEIVVFVTEGPDRFSDSVEYRAFKPDQRVFGKHAWRNRPTRERFTCLEIASVTIESPR